ncbi:hypothetical protein LDL59_05120 [Kaistella anthropi]|nr:hypothetical protein [Kaistella anthropi]
MKKILPFLLFLFALSFNAQVISSSKWSDLFSYNNVLAIREDNGKLIAATENGIFITHQQRANLVNFPKQTACTR